MISLVSRSWPALLPLHVSPMTTALFTHLEKEPMENGAVHDTMEKDSKENGASMENGATDDELEREPEENGVSEELIHVLEKEQNTLDNGGEVLQTPPSQKSTEKKTRPNKQVSVNSSRK